ncbi:MAG: hypothetical protein QXN96_00885 [Candidatus Bathyarchaeia archaeon]
MINQNELARKVAQMEGKKVQVNIAQIKEVSRCLLKALGEYKPWEVLRLIERVSGRK